MRPPRPVTSKRTGTPAAAGSPSFSVTVDWPSEIPERTDRDRDARLAAELIERERASGRNPEHVDPRRVVRRGSGRHLRLERELSQVGLVAEPGGVRRRAVGGHRKPVKADHFDPLRRTRRARALGAPSGS